MALGERMYKKGEVLRREAPSQPNYSNVILCLEDAGLITATKDEKSDKKANLYGADRKPRGNGSLMPRLL